MNKLPDKIREEIRERVFSLADQEGYLTNGRRKNATFISRLVEDTQIGGTLSSFMPEGEVRTYIKDAVLNRYSKEKRSIDSDLLTEWVSESYGEDMSPIATTNDVIIFKSCQSNMVLVLSKGTHVKWETALRKLLLYVGANPNLRNTNSSLRKMIVIPTAGVPIPTGEDEILRRALAEVGVDLLIK